MKIEIGTLTSRLVTDNPKILKALSDKYAYFVPGYQYVHAYRKRHWDGKKRYFKNNGTFKTGLLPRILKDIKSIGSDYTIDLDNTSLVVKAVESFEYRDYQKEAIQHCIKRKRCILDSPTGSGKTLIMAGILKSLNPSKAIILFKEKLILTQTYEFLESCGIDRIGINYGEGYVYGDIMLTTVQSIDKILDTHLEEVELLMIDEAHQFCKGETTIAAIESFPNATNRFAFTATVPGETSKDINARMVLEGAFGEVFTTRSAEDLIKDGSLAKPIIQIVENAPAKPVDDGISYQEIYEDFIVNEDSRNQKIQKISEMIYKGDSRAKVLILVKNLQHIENLKNLIPNAYVIEGKDNIKKRYEVIKKFLKDKKPATIIGTNVMQTGISIDEISHMINARGLEGEIPTLQGLGRGVRKAKGKDIVYFYDFYDKLPYLEKHSKSRIKHYKKLKFEVSYGKI